MKRSNKPSTRLIALFAWASACLCPSQSRALSISVLPDRTVLLQSPSTSGLQYWLETSPDLANWFLQGSIIPGTGAMLSMTNDPGTASRGFFRINQGPLIAHPLFGLNLGVYLQGQTPDLRTPITRAQLEQRIRSLVGYVEWIRTFSMVDGNQLAGQIAHRLGLKAALGAWLGREDTPQGLQANQENIANLIAAGQAGEADLLIVGSEVTLRGDLSVTQLLAYMNQVRAAVPGIPVTTADVYSVLNNTNIFLDNWKIIPACDVVMPNIYPFWESRSIDDALTSVHINFLNTRRMAGAKPVWVSEAGWPSDGQTVGAAVPSPANAALFFQRFSSWARAGGVQALYFDSHDEAFKATHEGLVGAHWGVWDQFGVMKPGMQPAFDNEFYPANWNAPINGPGTPSITFTSIPPTGSSDTTVSGTVNHIAPFDGYVSLYIKVGTSWWEKPYSNAPFTAITATGTWSNTFVTGGSDASATEFAAFVFPRSYIAPAVGNAPTLPAGLYSHAIAQTSAIRP